MTKTQKLFKELVDKEVKRLNSVFPENIGTKYDWKHAFPYAFSECGDKVSVDGSLYAILNYGSDDYNFGEEFGLELSNKFEKIGYYLESEGLGVFVFSEI